MKKFHFSYKHFVCLLIFILLIIFIANPFNLGSSMRGMALKVGHPFLKVFYFTGEKVRSGVDFFGSISSLQSENERLLRENNYLRKDLAVFGEVEKENEELRKQLDLIPRDKFDLEVAMVINRSSFGSGSWILVDKGRSQGVSEGMPVIVCDGILIGRVGEVFDNKAQIVLLSDPESVVNVKDAETGTRGLVRGEYGLGIFLDMVEQGEAINQGDTLVTSGLGEDMPENLLIGELQDVQNSNDKLFQQAVVSSQVRYFDLKTVFIIKN